MIEFIRVTYLAAAAFMHDLVNAIFGPILLNTLKPLNDMFTNVFQPWAMIVTLSFFIGVMIWVWVGCEKTNESASGSICQFKEIRAGR